MRWKFLTAIALCAALVAVPTLTFQGRARNQAQAAESLSPEAQPYNTVVRWTRETQSNKMGDDIVMSLGYNAQGDTVVTVLENEDPIITTYTYDEQGRKVAVHSYDDGKEFVYSQYAYNEQGDQTQWIYQARTAEGVTETVCTYEYTYDANGEITQKDSYQNDVLTARETYSREHTTEGTVVRTITDGDLASDLTCYDDNGKPLWREKGEYRMVYYYDEQGRETENCVINAGMQQNRTLTVYGDDGNAIRRILYGTDINDVVSTSEIETLTGAPKAWVDFAQSQNTTVIVAQGQEQEQPKEEQPAQTTEQAAAQTAADGQTVTTDGQAAATEATQQTQTNPTTPTTP